MHILFTTYGLILVLALFSFAQWKNAESLLFTDLVSTAKLQLLQEEVSKRISENAIPLYKPPKSEESLPDQSLDEENAIRHADHPDDSEEDQKKKERLFSALNIAPLFWDENPSLHDGKGKACFELLKSLMTILYEDQEFFQHAKEMQPDIEDTFVLSLISGAKEYRKNHRQKISVPTFADFDLGEEVFKEIRRKVIGGTKSRREEATKIQGYYCLDDFITMNKNPHIVSLWIAPRPILLAIFANEEAVNEVIAFRKDLHPEILKEKRSIDGKKKENSTFQTQTTNFRNRFKEMIPTYLQGYINFDVSTTNPPTS